MALARICRTPSGLSVGTEALGSAIRISLHGELDLAGEAVARQSIEGAFDVEPEEIVLDLSRLTFMDSTGVHLVAAACARARAAGTRLKLVPGPPAIQRVFELANAARPDLTFAWGRSPIPGGPIGF